MATPVELPKLGNTVEECILFRWAKHPGDAVAAGDVVAEIETDKAAFELTAPVEGTVLATFFEEGALVPVFTNMFVIGKPGEDVEEFRPKAATASSSAPAKMGGTAPAATASAAPATATQDRASIVSALSPGALSPRARRFAREHDFFPESIVGTGPSGRILEHDLEQLYQESLRVRPAISPV
jgi:pyruvate dehydrogenase E2 component (dihydrolipoamide acetyltransferase)